MPAVRSASSARSGLRTLSFAPAVDDEPEHLMREIQIDGAKAQDISQSHDDLNPNMKFVERNQFVRAIAENTDMKAYLEATPISWIDDQVTLRYLRLRPKSWVSEIYKAPRSRSGEASMEKDSELWYALFKNVIARAATSWPRSSWGLRSVILE